MNKLLCVDVYLDNTPFYGNPAFDNGDDNMFTFSCTEESLRKWYKMHEEDFIEEQMFDLGITREECSFEKWYNEVYVADDLDGFYQFCIDSKRDVGETCPHCDFENEFEDWSPEDGYIKTCSHCGQKMFLCDECMHADDNQCGKCDWHDEEIDGKKYSVCFRGRYEVKSDADLELARRYAE